MVIAYLRFAPLLGWVTVNYFKLAKVAVLQELRVLYFSQLLSLLYFFLPIIIYLLQLQAYTRQILSLKHYPYFRPTRYSVVKPLLTTRLFYFPAHLGPYHFLPSPSSPYAPFNLSQSILRGPVGYVKLYFSSDFSSDLPVVNF